MNSVFKLSLFAAALAFAVPNIAMAATAAPAPAKHQNAHKYYKGHRHSKKVQTVSQGDQETADLNARSLQLVQSVNSGATQQAAPNAGSPMPASPNNQQRVVIAPGTANTVAPPAAPMAPAPAGAVNPNNMPPAQ